MKPAPLIELIVIALGSIGAVALAIYGLLQLLFGTGNLGWSEIGLGFATMAILFVLMLTSPQIANLKAGRLKNPRAKK